MLRVAAAQLDTVVGDLDGNVGRIVAALHQAEAAGSEVCVFPELAVTGYPPEDLLLKPGFVADGITALHEVVAATGSCAAVVGFAEPLAAGRDRPGATLANSAAVCAAGRIVGVCRKQLLPNYGVFDERRWFVPGDEEPVLYEIAGALVGVSICEDLWAPGPLAALGRAGAQVVVNLNASPYSRGRRQERLAVVGDRVRETGCAIVYVNQVGGQDELVFDGASLVVGADGSLLAAGAQFTEDLVVVDVPLPVPRVQTIGVVSVVSRPRSADAGIAGPGAAGPGTADAGTAEPRAPGLHRGPPPQRLPPHLPAPLSEVGEVYSALATGTGDYLSKNGFTTAVIGLSGGIDSSLVATIAVDAVGPGHVRGFAMPSRYSSEGSVRDAAELARRLGIELVEVPIEVAHTAFGDLLQPVLGGRPDGLVDENLQSRLRGVLLMAVSNATGAIVLTTGNKSEMATGYSTLYGDSAGGFAVIKDVPKTLVYQLCRYRNQLAESDGGIGPIPSSVLEKPPSAELRPDQRDEDSLPPYDVLDRVLGALVERDQPAAELVAEGVDPSTVVQVARLVDQAEYKRRQSPPGVRITPRAFGKDRRMPITHRYVEPVPVPVPPTGSALEPEGARHRGGS